MKRPAGTNKQTNHERHSGFAVTSATIMRGLNPAAFSVDIAPLPQIKSNDVDPFLVQLEEMGQEEDLNTSYSRAAVRMDSAAADVIVVLAARIPPLALAVRHPIPT